MNENTLRFEDLPSAVFALTKEVAEVKQLLKTAPAPTTAQPAEAIGSEELCRRLDISKPTAWSWEKKGIIAGYHLGNRKYFIWAEVLTALTKKASPAK